MSSILLTIGVIVVLAIATVLILAAMKSDTCRVQRSLAIAAPPERIFPHISDFHCWPAWSPYEGKDPAMKKTFSGAASGKGAIYEWEGDKNVGKGRIEITDTSPSSRLALNLDMLKPFEAHNKVEFILLPQGEGTLVTWEMNGHAPYLAKIMHVFFNMDRMIGGDFERGLIKLKTVAEGS
jgi:uncharacterized protein YndB with AHSA1/START domain